MLDYRHPRLKSVEETISSHRLIRFGTFEVDLESGELRKGGAKLKLSGQPFQVLAILLEQPGAVVTREELQKRLWPDTFVDVDHSLNTSINKIRDALGDSAESPRFVETLPRRGYRFIAPVEGVASSTIAVEPIGSNVPKTLGARGRALRLLVLPGVCVLLVGAGISLYKYRHVATAPVVHALTRITFDDGLQNEATWSPDGRFIAYSSDRGGKFDIWVQQVSGGDPVQITKGPGQNWQPDWSPDGKNIVYRSEDGYGGLFVVPAFGGDGRERRIASFGYHPRWSPDSSQILFQTQFLPLDFADKFYVVRLDGTPPREVLAGFIAEHKRYPISAVWHPDGKRITASIFGSNRPGSVMFWTVPIRGGTAIKTEIDPTIEKQFASAAAEGVAEGILPGISFSWSPSGNAIYFEGRSGRTVNIWKMTIDPGSLGATALERLSTGPGPDAEVAISHDGKRLAFTAKSEHIRTRLFPFDASTGRLSGEGQPITAAGRAAAFPVLSRDGNQLAFCTMLDNGQWELWQKSLADGREAPVITDDYSRAFPQWSLDGMQLAYTRSNTNENKNQLMVWSRQSHSEEPLTSTSSESRVIYDWSPDGKWLLISKASGNTSQEIWMLPLASVPHAETAGRKIASDHDYDLWEPHFSPNGRWIAFEAVTNLPTSLESSIYVMPVEGGTWTRITNGKQWDDKPRWSPDGKTIYYISGVGGFFNLWGIQFDPSTGQPAGEGFQLSAFKGPSLMIPQRINLVALSLSQGKLVLTTEEVSGSIWVLDNVDR